MARISIAVLLIFVLTFTLTPFTPVRAATLYVEATPGACGGLTPTYSTVSAAITAALDGDTIVLCEDIVEPTTQIVINKILTITGAFQGNIYKWTVQDTDSTNPALSITSDTTFSNIELAFTSTAGDPADYIDVSGARLVLDSVNLIGYNTVNVVTASQYSLIKASNSVVEIRNSDITYVNIYNRTVYSTVIKLISSDLTVNPSNIINSIPGDWTTTGAVIEGTFDGTVDPNNMISVESSFLSAIYSFVDVIRLNSLNNNKLLLNISDATLTARNYRNLIRVSVTSSANVSIYVLGSSLSGYNIFSPDINGGILHVYINPSNITATRDFFKFTGLAGGHTEIDIVNSNINGTGAVSDLFDFSSISGAAYVDISIRDTYMLSDGDGFDFRGNLYDTAKVLIDIYNSSLRADDEVFEIENLYGSSQLNISVSKSTLVSDTDQIYGDIGTDLYDSSLTSITTVDSALYADEEIVLFDTHDTSYLITTFINSEMENDWDEVLEYDLYGGSEVEVYFINSIIYDGLDGIDLDLYSTSYGYVYVEDSFITVEDDGLEIYTNDFSTFEGDVIRSFIGEIDIRSYDVSNLDLNLIETVYDEINSYTWETSAYSEWTIWVFALSKNSLNPLPGTMIDLLYGGTSIASFFTGGDGSGTYTLSYYYNSSDPFITNLVISANYKGVVNQTHYMLFSIYTTPKWWGNLTLMLDVFILRAQLAGHIGYGSLDISGDSGKLVIGAQPAGGWMNYYNVRVVSVGIAEYFMRVSIKVSYNGVWVDGYILVNLKNGLVYLRFGGVELYGFLKR